MSGFLFSSHDRFGLSQVRRNAKVASAIRAIDPGAPIVFVTGVAGRFGWLDRTDVHVIRSTPMARSPFDHAESPGVTLDEAIAERSRTFAHAVQRHDPDVVVVDRHPFGIFGELREGLELARSRGARIVLGLRDMLDDSATVAEELHGTRWAGAADAYHEALVYGERHLCDHEREYELPIRPSYSGWLVDPARPRRREARLLAIAAGGGSDGEAICRLGLEVLSLQPRWTATFAAGPYGGEEALSQSTAQSPDGPGVITTTVDGSTRLFARASGALLEAAYNSTYEALAAGLRPIFPLRGSARREESIRATRLVALGIADAFPEGVVPGDVARLLDRPRLLPAAALRNAGITLDGAPRAARHLLDRARQRRTVRARASGRSSRTPAALPIARGPKLAFAGPAVGDAG
jgi:predicted glycosyltransferase